VGHGAHPRRPPGELGPLAWHAKRLGQRLVRHGGGGDVLAGVSICAFKSYEKGREKWQGPTIDGVWFDEEPEMAIYTEGLTRTNNGQRGQFAIMTFTPLLGVSDVVHMFLDECGFGDGV
jgi:phage terminase large subunit-like protein